MPRRGQKEKLINREEPKADIMDAKKGKEHDTEKERTRANHQKPAEAGWGRAGVTDQEQHYGMGWRS